MARRIRLVKIDKQKMFGAPPVNMGLIIIMCVMVLVLVQILQQPALLRVMAPQEESTRAPLPGQASPTEVMKAHEKAAQLKLPASPRALLSTKEEQELLSTVVDQEPLEKKPYFYMLAKVNAMTDAQIDAAVDPTITYDTFADNPASARGRIVKLQGHLKRLKETRITDVIGSGFESVWEGNLIDNDLRVISFVLTQPPPKGVFEPGRDIAIVKGVFLKNIVYRDRGGGFTASPLIIAKKLVKVVPPPASPSLWSKYRDFIIFVVILAGVVGFIYFGYRRRLQAGMSLRVQRPLPEGPLELVPDEEVVLSSEESQGPIQHVNPGTDKCVEKTAENLSKPPEEKKENT